MAGIAAMIAVSARTCQFALLDTLSGSEPLIEGAEERLDKTVELIVGFRAGYVVGADTS
jgi:hypothetical protein